MLGERTGGGASAGETTGNMIRIFPDFSVQVTAAAAGGGGGGGGMVTGPPVGRVPVQGATNGSPQSVQGLSGYQQRYAGRRPVELVRRGR